MTPAAQLRIAPAAGALFLLWWDSCMAMSTLVGVAAFGVTYGQVLDLTLGSHRGVAIQG